MSYDKFEIFRFVFTPAVLLGEGPMFMPKSDRFTKDKTDMLNSYREMNKDLAEEYSIPYIDMRQAFLDAIPSYRLNYKVTDRFLLRIRTNHLPSVALR